jgi:hypothetical protein
MTNLAPYPEWGGPRLADPRQATLDQLESGLTDIVASEGPILKDRLFALYARAADLGRIYDLTRTKLENGLKQALRNKSVTADTDIFGDFEELSLRLPDQPTVIARERSSRTLHEIPAPEIAELMLEIRLEHELISKEDLFRAVLKTYELKRLTKATEERLTAILETWIM